MEDKQEQRKDREDNRNVGKDTKIEEEGKFKQVGRMMM